MAHVQKIQNLARKFRKDENGSFALSFAVSALTLMIAAGAAYDMNQLHASKAKAQLISDTVGLTATAYVKNHGKPPKSSKDGYVHNHTYSAKKEGFDLGPATAGKSDVKFRVVYDEKKGQATVHMKGELETSFMGMFGYQNLSFANKSVVKYSASDLKDPASIFLVMDNSGSMNWGDKTLSGKYGTTLQPGTQRRITGLKKTVSNFNDYLGKTVGSNTKDKTKQYLRMGMTAYNSSLIPTRTVVPKWGTLSNGNIQRMVAGGGTDPRKSMAQAYEWMQKENRIHEKVNGSKDPLKYVIFMSDGVNNKEYVCDWRNQKGTKQWRAKINGRYYYWNYSRRKPRNNAVEGRRSNCRYEANATKATLDICNKLKKNGVEVYTIGYALEPGRYATNPPSTRWKTTLSSSSSKEAYDFLKGCASDPDHFVKAENTAALEAAFDKIGADIIADVIRIAS